MKKLYLATVCFLPIAMIPLFYAVYLRHAPFPEFGFQVLEAYFFIGFLFLLVDLWRSPETTGAKALWTVLNLTVGLIALPIYWFVVVCHPKPPSEAVIVSLTPR